MRCLSVLILSGLLAGAGAARANDPIIWSVANPFRFYQSEDSFKIHKQAFDKIVAAYNKQIGNSGEPKLPDDLVWRIERELNKAECGNPQDYDACAAELRKKGIFEATRSGWASRVFKQWRHYPIFSVCYGPYGDKVRIDRKTNALRLAYPANCYRDSGNGATWRAERYINPRFHSVRARLADAIVKQHADNRCQWIWRDFKTSLRLGLRIAPCNATVLMDNIPYPDGARVSVSLNRRTLAETHVKVTDLLVVGLGDSYASGEGNPDVPIALDRVRKMPYGDIVNNGDGTGLVHIGDDGHTHPFRHMRGAIDTANDFLDVNADGPNRNRDATERRFKQARALWISEDCHRSQYSYQFRVALQMALDNPHRAVTLVHLACTGAEFSEGLFGEKPARETGAYGVATVLPQIDQLLRIICNGRSASGTAFTMKKPRKWGQEQLVEAGPFSLKGCRDNKRRREIDLVLLSAGGNDIGFSGVVGRSIIEDTGDIATILPFVEALSGNKLVFDPVPAYIGLLQKRMTEFKRALTDLAGVRPGSVIHTAYENFLTDAGNASCSGTRGVDIHKAFAYNKARIDGAEQFRKQFFKELRCLSAGGADCGSTPAAGYHFVESHQAKFQGRGICAIQTGAKPAAYRFPTFVNGAFAHFNPANYLPYVPRLRLSVSSNDAFLTANSDDIRPKCNFDLANCRLANDKTHLLYTAIYSGAFHRTAEAHAILADEVMKAVRAKFPASTAQ